MLISACLIVKDEAAFLPQCLAALEGLADEIVIVDTGSTDDTVAIAERAGARVFHRPWDGDFSAARNAGLNEARGDFILYIDADEEVVEEDRPRLRRLLTSGAYDALNVAIVSPIHDSDKTNVVRYPRVFRRYPDVHFTCAIHEQIWPSLAPHEPRVLESDVTILHHGYNQPEAVLEHKRRRNLDTALAVLADEPNNSFYLYHAGIGYLQLDEPASAVRWLERALRFTEEGRDQAPVMNALAQAHFDQSQHGQAESWLKRSLDACAAQHHAWALLADLQLLRQRHHDAIAALRECLAIERSELHTDVTPSRSTLLMKLGMCELLTHQPSLAAAHLEECLAGDLTAEHRQTARRYLAMARRLTA